MELYNTITGIEQDLNDMIDTIWSIINSIDGYLKILIACTLFITCMLFVVMILISVMNSKLKNMQEDLFYIRQDLKYKK